MDWEQFLELMIEKGVDHALPQIYEHGDCDTLLDITELVQTGSLTVEVDGQSYVVSMSVEKVLHT